MNERLIDPYAVAYWERWDWNEEFVVVGKQLIGEKAVVSVMFDVPRSYKHWDMPVIELDLVSA